MASSDESEVVERGVKCYRAYNIQHLDSVESIKQVVHIPAPGRWLGKVDLIGHARKSAYKCKLICEATNKTLAAGMLDNGATSAKLHIINRCACGAPVVLKMKRVWGADPINMQDLNMVWIPV